MSEAHAKIDWRDLAATSPYLAAVAVREALERLDVSEASEGIQEVIDALSRSERRALKSQLIRLMAHIIKWQAQPERRSRSWRASINGARREIADIQYETPSLGRSVIESLWSDCFEAAKDEAEGEMDRPSPVASLSWAAVFEDVYEVDAGPSRHE